LTRLGIEGLYGGADGKNKSFKSRISTQDQINSFLSKIWPGGNNAARKIVTLEEFIAIN